MIFRSMHFYGNNFKGIFFKVIEMGPVEPLLHTCKSTHESCGSAKPPRPAALAFFVVIIITTIILFGALSPCF